MPEKKKIKRSPRGYWEGKGRRVIMVPNTSINKLLSKNNFFNIIYVTDMGCYPKAASHHVEREKGSPENIIFYCADGRGWYETAGRRFDVYPNQFFILPSNQGHHYGAASKSPWSIYWVMFEGDLSGDINLHQAMKHCFQPNTLVYPSKFFDLYEEMFDILSTGFTINNLVFANMSLWLMLMMLVYQRTSNLKEQKVKPVEKVINLMKENISRKLSINEMADTAYYSPSHLYNLFKSQTGYSPIDYFIHLKMQCACNYLNNTSLRIKEIAPLVGYEDPYLFSRIFTKIMGQSPQNYRSTIRV
jgi:AraC-like DNA-binding protein